MNIMKYMSYSHFGKTERLEVSVPLKRGYSHREIGSALGKRRSSVSGEIKRNSVNGRYDPNKANHKSYVKRKYAKYQGMKIRERPELEKCVKEKTISYWTPEQMAGRWNDENKQAINIGAPSVYKYVYGIYGRQLCQYLCARHERPKRRQGKKQTRQNIPNRVSIEERPEYIENRQEFGHFEGDALGRIKTDTEAVVGGLERMSQYILLKKVPRLKYAMEGFKEFFNPHHNIVESLTLDNGVENIHYQELNIPTYFCNPYHSREKGLMENAFKRLGRFIPKKTNLRLISNEELSVIAEIINNTPRKCLNWKTPKEVFEEQRRLKTQSNINDYFKVEINNSLPLLSALSYPQCRT